MIFWKMSFPVKRSQKGIVKNVSISFELCGVEFSRLSEIDYTKPFFQIRPETRFFELISILFHITFRGHIIRKLFLRSLSNSYEFRIYWQKKCNKILVWFGIWVIWTNLMKLLYEQSLKIRSNHFSSDFQNSFEDVWIHRAHINHEFYFLLKQIFQKQKIRIFENHNFWKLWNRENPEHFFYDVDFRWNLWFGIPKREFWNCGWLLTKRPTGC